MKNRFRILLFFFPLVLNGCASLAGKKIEIINQTKVEYVLVGHGLPVVVFENGFAGTIDEWAKVAPEISKETSVFVYNRPGYEKSEPVSTPRDGEHIVNELRRILQNKNLKPPYILVGHSYGGLLMQYFARAYPGEVAALILVDSTHPESFEGKGAPEHWPGWYRNLFFLLISKDQKKEFGMINKTGKSILALPPFSGKPVIVLSAKGPLKQKGELADYENQKRKELAGLYPGSSQVWIDSGHNIPTEKPEAVIDAVRTILQNK